MLLQLLPYSDRHVLGGGEFIFHEIDVQVQVPVVYFFDHHILDELAQRFCIENETRLGVWHAFYRDVQLIIMPVPVVVRTFAEYFQVLLPAPFRVE